MFFSHTPKNNDKRLGFDRYNTPSLGRHALPKPGDLPPFSPRQPLPQTPVEEPRKMLSEAERAAILAVPDKRGSLYVSVWAPHANEAGEELPPVQGRHFLDALQLVATCHRKQGRLDSAEASLQRPCAATFRQLVLGGIDASDSESGRIFQHYNFWR